jgi:hypothetical protein
MNHWRNGNESNDGRTLSRCAPDAELVLAARRGDKRASWKVVARHQAMVCGIALGILGDFAASEDTAQEASRPRGANSTSFVSRSVCARGSDRSRATPRWATFGVNADTMIWGNTR